MFHSTARRLVDALRRPGALVCAGFVLAAAAVAGPGAATAFADETIYASGSSWSANAMDQWIADMASRGVPVQFNVSSSGQGRQDFANYQNDFANSDIPYQGADPLTGQPDTPQGRGFAYMPIVAGGTALMYHLQQGNAQITNIRLSGRTIVRIFTGAIKMWNDPAITADMDGIALPAKKIQVVVESNGSGTTAQFTDWMAQQYGDLWGPYAGKNVATSYYPVNAPNMTAQNGDAQVAQTITSSGYDGAIGYVQYSYALNAHYPSVKVENAAHYFTLPTPLNVAVALTQATIHDKPSDAGNPSVYLTQDLSHVYSYNDPRSYPLSSYSYSIIPTDPADHRIDAAKAQTFVDFAQFFMCQGQNTMPTLGYSPLTVNLVAEGFAQVKKYSKVNPTAFPNLDPTKCNNPTYDPQDPTKNRLALLDPVPQSCDQQGQIPCGAAGAAAGGGGAGTASGAGAGGAGNTAATTGAGAAGAGAGINPETGLPFNAGSNGSGSVGATTTDLAAFRSHNDTTVMGVLAAIELVLVLLVPAFVARTIARRRTRDNNGDA